MRGLVLIICCLALSVQAQEPYQACLSFAKQYSKSELNLKKDCPALFAELEHQGVLMTSEPLLLAKVTLAQLKFLADSRQLLRGASSIRQDGLDQLLAGILDIDVKDPQSEWWQAFLKWLDNLKTGDYEAEYQWLIGFMETIKPSEQTILYFIYGSMALLVISSLWLVLRELYLAGFFVKLTEARKSFSQLKSRHEHGLYLSATPLSIDELPPHRQIAALLAQVIDTLVERKIIPCDVTLTYRQIAKYIGQSAAGFEPAFTHLVHEAEPLLYGNRPVDAQVLGNYRRNVQALLGNSVL